MAFRSEKNLYPGVNPHLNSALQQPGGGWKSFHAYHIIHIAEGLDDSLPPDYIVRPEESIQISYYDPETDAPDPTVTEDEDSLTGLVIYRDQKPVTRIELLSPSNKPGGAYYGDYLNSRSETLLAGLRLVEIDFLHEQRPIRRDIPSYKAQHSGAFPYHILISDPRPTVSDGRTKVYSRGVLDMLPALKIPLESSDTVRFDFGAAYHHTVSRRTFWETIDYSREPVNFAAYTEADQQAIRHHMAAITGS